jgi:hypothetical protein
MFSVMLFMNHQMLLELGQILFYLHLSISIVKYWNMDGNVDQQLKTQINLIDIFENLNGLFRSFLWE